MPAEERAQVRGEEWAVKFGPAAYDYPDFIDKPFEGWKIDPAKAKELSRLSPARSILHICAEWAIVFAAILISHRIGIGHGIAGILAYAAAIILIGSRQHSFLLLMHEATHWRLLNNKRWNDIICELFLTWPVMASLRAFRHIHLQHHRELNLPTDGDQRKKLEDPNWHFPLPRRRLLWSLTKQFTGLGTWYVLKVFRYGNANPEASGQTRAYRTVRLIYYVLAVSLIVYFHVFTLFLLYWMVPLLTSMIALNRMRVLSEHPPIERASEYGIICLYQLSPIERLLFAPKNCHYHIEHHSYPSVPFFNLPRLHREMLANADFRATLRPVSYPELLKSLSATGAKVHPPKARA